MNALLQQQFQVPAACYRGRPFWCWNGRLERDELIRQIQTIKAMGFGGFFMHSRTGLATTYLSEEWFGLINACADEAERLGLEAWLYDEDRWPSGTAGGMVTARPEFRMKALRLRVIRGKEFTWGKGYVAAFVCDLEGLAYDRCDRIGTQTPPSQYRDRTVLAFCVETHAAASFYNGQTYVDTLNRQATDHFLELTHEQYRRHCGERLGRSIRGIFTDEPHRGPLLERFAMPNAEPHWTVPWTYDLFEEFERRFGYDLVARLPELFLRYQGRAVSQVKWHFVELLQQLFLENFAAPCADWCRKNGLILTGHVLHEDSLAAQTAVSGSVMRYYEHLDWPGVDVLTESNRAFWIVKQLQSAARQLGRRWLLSELYGCTGWQMNLAGHKAVGDWQALMGINVRCPHLAWFTMEGEAKRDFPGSIFHQSAWWPEYAAVENYFARMGVMGQQGERVCDLLVLNPVESLWCQIYPGWSDFLHARDEAAVRLEEMYASLFRWLTRAQLDFDYGDEEMLGRLGSVQFAGGRPRLRLGQADYAAVLVGGMVTMRATTLELLAEFQRAGGRIIFAGERPTHVDALESHEPACLAERSTGVEFEERAVVRSVRTVLEPALEILDFNGEPLREILAQLCRDGERLILLLLNTDRELAIPTFGVRLRVQGEPSVQQWDCFSGERHGIASRREGDWLVFKTDFVAGSERLFVIGSDLDPVPPLAAWQTVARHTVEGPFEYRLDEANVCVLDLATWHIVSIGETEGVLWNGPLEILKVDQAIREKMGLPRRSGEMLQPWFAGRSTEGPSGRVELRFEFVVEQMPQSGIELAIERPGECAVRINDVALDQRNSPGHWIDQAFVRLPVPVEALRPGCNEICVQMNYHAHSGLEALYLLGSFGVALDGSKKTLVALPERLTVGDITTQGLPFYSGRIALRLPDLPRPGEGEAAFLTLPALDAACARVGERLIPWAPYEADVSERLEVSSTLELELVLTRRNTFGPLHMVPPHASWYGPGEFVTEGDSFSERYILWPAGLAEAPVIEMRRAY